MKFSHKEIKLFADKVPIPFKILAEHGGGTKQHLTRPGILPRNELAVIQSEQRNVNDNRKS